MSEPLRLALVTDIHHGAPKMTKKGDAALPLLREFVTHANATAPHAVIDLGDRISDVDRDTDRRLETEVGSVFAELEVPHLHLLGNHDMEYLDAPSNADALSADISSRVIAMQGIRLIVWQANVSIDRVSGLTVSDADLDWLRGALTSDDSPAVVLTHVPLDNASMVGNYYFQNNPEFAGYSNGAAIRRTIQDTGNVLACLAGHTHWNRLSTIDGIAFITVQSLTESFTTNGEASAAWAEIEIGDSIRWRTIGNDPIEMVLPKRSHNRRWVAPLPPFAERRRNRGGNLEGVDGLILDLDGVVYRGLEPIEGAREFLAAQRSAGRRLVALTNNAQASAADYAAKLAGMGIEFPASDILTAGEATAAWLAKEGLLSAYVIGSAALRGALHAHGIEGSDDPEVVVVGMSSDTSMPELMTAVKHLSDGARLIATNPDSQLPLEGGTVTAECGALIAFLESATGRKAEVIGKPGAWMFEWALGHMGLSREAALMVGDTPATDIAGAINSGVRSAQVGTGNPDDARIVPTVRVDSLAALGPLLD